MNKKELLIKGKAKSYDDDHNGIFKLFNADGSHYEIPVGAWIVKTPDGYNVASKAKYKQKPADNEPKFKVKKVNGTFVLILLYQKVKLLQLKDKHINRNKKTIL